MKTLRRHRAVLVAVLVLSPALTTACGLGGLGGLSGRDGAAADQAALKKALSAVTVPKGLTPSGAISVTCDLNLDCADIGSTITYAPIKGNVQTCKAAMAIQTTVQAVKVRWKGVENNFTPDATWAAGALPGVAAVPPRAEDMTAACVKALSSKQAFLILSDLQPNAVPVKSAQALVTVADADDDNPGLVIGVTYDGPDW